MLSEISPGEGTESAGSNNSVNHQASPDTLTELLTITQKNISLSGENISLSRTQPEPDISIFKVNETEDCWHGRMAAEEGF